MSATGIRVDISRSARSAVEAFGEALNDALGRPGDDAPWRRLEETVAADEAQEEG